MKTLHLSIIIILLITIIFNTNHAFAQYGCPPVEGGWHPQIATSGNTVYVLWNYFYNCGQRILLLRSSNDGGETFGNSVTVAGASQSGSDPAVTSSNGNLYLAWIHYYPLPSTLLFKTSGDNGTTFSDTVTIDTNGTVQDEVQKVLVYGNNIGIIWTGNPPNGVRSIYLSESSDGGKSFGGLVRLSATTGDSFSPQAVQEGNKAYVLWGSFGICNQARQACPGYSYIVAIDLSNNFTRGTVTNLGQYGGWLAVSGSSIYIAGTYNSDTNPSVGTSKIIFLRSTDGGVSFEKPVTLVSYQAHTNHLNGLKVNVSGKNVYVTWYDFHTPETGAEILMMASNDEGVSFSNIQTVDPSDVHLNGPESPSFDLNTLAEGNNYYATYQSYTSLDQIGQGIFFRKSTDGGMTLDNKTDLTGKIIISNPGYDFVSDGTNLYIAGPDYAFKDSNHIMFSKSNDGGNSFSPQIDLDQNSLSMVPEFPFAIPILLIGLVSSIVFYRMKFRK
jgi:hypothetical protein